MRGKHAALSSRQRVTYGPSMAKVECMILYDWLGIMAIIIFVVCAGLLYEIADRVCRATEVGPSPATIPRLWRRWLGHKNIQHTVRYTELAPDRFEEIWR